MQLNSLINKFEYLQRVGNEDTVISSIQFDSREVEKGSLYVAIKGTIADGHTYIPQAIEKGAVAIVCEVMPQTLEEGLVYFLVRNSNIALGQLANTWFGYPSRDMKLVGVTGTNGKTTIATLLYKLFKNLGYACGLISTVSNFINDREVVANYTTPDAMELNRLLSQMRDEGCDYVFMEVSSHAIDQHRIESLEFDGAIFSNITRDHLDYHITFDNYLKAKKAFFDQLDKSAFALTNIDDKNGMVMLQNTKALKKSYSLQSIADFKTKILEDDFSGMLLDINNKEIHMGFIGHFNAYNLTAVYATALLLGQDELEVLTALSSLNPVSGRFETIHAPKGFIAIVDYAHTPDALKNVISSINEILKGNGNLITVVGAGGNRDVGKRPLMAQQAVWGSWKAILTADNPRNEEPMDIINDMLAGLSKEEQAQSLVITDRREAIKTACSLAQKNDVVLIAGKGHEDYQIIKGVKHHFDDREEVKKAIGLL